jgi:hypothetical protein
MITLLKSLIYIEVGGDSVLLNVKWSLLIVMGLLQWFVLARALKSFRRRS